MNKQKRASHGRRPGTSTNQSILLLVIGLGLVLIAIAVLLWIPKAQTEAQQISNAAQPVSVDFQAPEVKVTDFNNNPVALSDFKGQVVLYNSWATWCPPCKEEMPTLDAYYQAHKQDGFVVIAIEDGEPASEVADFAKSHNLSFPVWPDLKWIASTAFKTQVLPASFVIDRTGRVVLAWTGPITRESLEKFVTPVIRQ